MTECEQFPGRLRDLCEGRGREGRSNPPRYAVDAFRAQHGLARLSDDPEERARQLARIIPVPDAAEPQAYVPPVVIPADGPGRRLEAIFAQLQVPYGDDCQCQAYARQMDVWGAEGCRAHFDEIVARLRENAQRYSLWQQLEAAVRTVAIGLAFQLNPLDPLPGLVAEAIRRAEAAASSSHHDKASQNLMLV
jgi:hypothetical protein